VILNRAYHSQTSKIKALNAFSPHLLSTAYVAQPMKNFLDINNVNPDTDSSRAFPVAISFGPFSIMWDSVQKYNAWCWTRRLRLDTRHSCLLKVSRDRFAPGPLPEQHIVQLKPFHVQKVEILSVTAEIDDTRNIQHPVTQLDRYPVITAK
jgi:hypothetical protein